MKKTLWSLILAVAASTALAGPEQRDLAKVMVDKYVKERGGLATALAKPAVDIEDRTKICGYCHGKEGNSTHPEIPSLAGQNPLYFVEQILVFQAEERYPKMMHGFARNLEDDAAVAVALHYSSLPRQVTMKVDATRAVRGKSIYAEKCAGCHGLDGRGTPAALATINGQRPDYLVTTMLRFRDPNQKRQSHEMGANASGLSNGQIEDIAHFVAGL